MNCERFEDLVSELARDQMMDAGMRISALSHAKECPRCHRCLHNQLALTQGLRALAERTNALTASETIELRLRQAMLEGNAPLPPTAAARHPRWGSWLAVAAAVLLFIGTGIAINWQRDKAPPVDEQFAAQPASVPDIEKREIDNESDNEQPNEKALAMKPRKPRRLSASGRVTANQTGLVSHHSREVATDFIPIGYVNSASFQEGGQIVRVELPRSALVRFGLPVNMERLNERVKADVWLGVDGLAHAIRFVQ